MKDFNINFFTSPRLGWEGLNGESITKTVVENSTKNRTEQTEEKSDTPILIQKSTGKIEKEKLQVSKQKKSETEEESLHVIHKLASAEGSKGEWWDYNNKIQSSKSKAIYAKQEIQNVLFKVQEQTLEVGGNNRLTDLKTTKHQQFNIRLLLLRLQCLQEKHFSANTANFLLK